MIIVTGTNVATTNDDEDDRHRLKDAFDEVVDLLLYSRGLEIGLIEVDAMWVLLLDVLEESL